MALKIHLLYWFGKFRACFPYFSSFTKSVLDSVVTGAFQITFHAKMHANDVFSFFKNYF
jgi:hypothetical protein